MNTEFAWEEAQGNSPSVYQTRLVSGFTRAENPRSVTMKAAWKVNTPDCQRESSCIMLSAKKEEDIHEE
jgi:hypothetical protein